MANNRSNNQPQTNVLFVGGNNDVGIGANCIIVENTDEKGKTSRIMFDLGMKLTAENPEYDGIVSDIREYLDRLDEEGNVIEPAKYPIDAIFITHAHEDHRGGFNSYEAIGYKFPKKYASPTTAKIEMNRINREGLNLNISDTNDVKTIYPENKIVKINDNFEVEAFDVSHSAVDSKGFHVLVKRADGNDLGLIFTGDFNMREMQAEYKDGRKDGFKEDEYLDLLSRKPVTHIFNDSTSSGSSDEFIFDKETCIEEWKKLIKEIEADGKHEIFTENIANSVEHLLKLAEATKRFNEENNRTRKIFIDAGNLKLAYQAYLTSGGVPYEDVIFNLDTKNPATSFNEQIPLEDQIVVFSGAFAEGSENTPNTKVLKLPSGTVKLSNGEKINPNQKSNEQKIGGSKTGHRFFKVGPNTAYVKAQRDVGINSKGVKGTIHKIAKLGAKVYQVATYEDASLGSNYSMHKIQSSGHASKNETLKFMKYHNPDKTIIVPIHGDVYQLMATQGVAKEAGFKSKVYKNASKIEILPNSTRLVEKNDEEKTYIAFRNEGMFREKVLVVDEVMVYPDHENPKIEHIYHVKNLGKHSATKIDGQWMDAKSVEKITDGKKPTKKERARISAEMAKKKYFGNNSK